MLHTLTLFYFPPRTISTPLIYQPRSRPPTLPPSPFHPATFIPRLDSRPDWQAFTTVIKAKRPFKGAPPNLEDIESKLYLHTTRTFPATQSIPFYLSLLSSPSTLAAFMPFGPQTPGSAGLGVFGAGGYQCTRMRLTRQVIVDAKSPAVQREILRDGSSTPNGLISSSSEMWDMTTIGEGSFKLFVSDLLQKNTSSHGIARLLISSALFHLPVDSGASSRPSLSRARSSLHTRRIVASHWSVMRHASWMASFTRLLTPRSMVCVTLRDISPGPLRLDD